MSTLYGVHRTGSLNELGTKCRDCVIILFISNLFPEIYKANEQTISGALANIATDNQSPTPAERPGVPSAERTSRTDKTNTPTIHPLLLEHIKSRAFEGEGLSSLLSRVALGPITRDPEGSVIINSATIYNSVEQKERLSKMTPLNP